MSGKQLYLLSNIVSYESFGVSEHPHNRCVATSSDGGLNGGHVIFLTGSKKGQNLVIRVGDFWWDSVQHRDKTVQNTCVLREMH